MRGPCICRIDVGPWERRPGLDTISSRECCLDEGQVARFQGYKEAAFQEPARLSLTVALDERRRAVDERQHGFDEKQGALDEERLCALDVRRFGCWTVPIANL